MERKIGKWKGEGDGDRNRTKSEIREKMVGEDKGVKIDSTLTIQKAIQLLS